MRPVARATLAIGVVLTAALAGAERMETALPRPGDMPRDAYHAGSHRVAVVESAREVVVAYQPQARVGRHGTSLSMTQAGLASAGREVAPGLVLHELTPGGSPSGPAGLAELAEVRYAYAALHTHDDDHLLLPTDEVVMRVLPHVSQDRAQALALDYGTTLLRGLTNAPGQYLLHLNDPKTDHPIAVANAMRQHPDVAWAEPNFLSEIRTTIVPNDPLFPQQWHLSNSGQTGGIPGADAGVLDAWNITSGTNSVTVAVFDNGVQLDHPDLVDAIYINELDPVDGIDNDGNGYVDDIHGWDFRDGDNDPGPSSGSDQHGTPVAGLIAARWNNNLGGSGIAPNVRILPIRIARGGVDFASSTVIAEAFRYAMAFADVFNNSWAGGGRSEILASAMQDALLEGRDGLGIPILFSSGNGASGWQRITVPISGEQPHTYRWEYIKDGSVTQHMDTVWLDDVTFPDGAHESFDDLEQGSLPQGWSSGGDRIWKVEDDKSFARGGSGRSLRSGAIGHNQSSWVEVTRDDPAGTLVFYVWVSSEPRYDLFRFYLDGELVRERSGGRVDSEVAAPASWPETIAVGASTDYDERAPYSQYGEALDLVAPSDGGSLGLWSTDLTGDDGYASGDYTLFGGTSAACPVASGAVALLLSHRPDLTAAQVRTLLHDSAVKIGPDAYDEQGRNDQYGHGRLHVGRLLQSATAAEPPRDSDGDGIPDSLEGHPPLAGQTNMYLVDSDGDGLWDGEEDINLSGHRDPGETNARDPDSDGDGLPDGVEVRLTLTDPLDPNDPLMVHDADGDGLPAHLDPNDNNRDSDGDRVIDSHEAVMLDLDAVVDATRRPGIGDISGDGLITNLDALLIHGFFLNKPLPAGVHLNHGDTNRDGHIGNLDALAAQAYFLSDVMLLPVQW